MKYYKFLYQGRDSGGCNTYRTHSLCVPGENDEEAVKMLDLKVTNINKTSSWPHTMIDILDCEEVDEEVYNTQELSFKLSQEKAKRIEKLNVIRRSFFEEFHRPPEFKWIDKDNNSWRLCDMKESHILNCINLLKNKMIVTELKIQLFEEELKRRKDEIDDINF